MSGTFWKVGQDYVADSSISKILERAFIKISDAASKTDSTQATEDPDSNDYDTIDDEENETSELIDALPSTDEEFANYKPNLEVIDDLLDDEELYTELLCSNFKLLVYLKYPQVLSRLIDYVQNESILDGEDERDHLTDAKENLDDEIVTDTDYANSEEKDLGQPIDEDQASDGNISEISEETTISLPPGSEEQDEVRRARMAAEVLSADVWPIASAITSNYELLIKLWKMMDHESGLSIEASTYFMKINERLLEMNLNDVLVFILNQENLVERFLRHIDNPPLMDFLLKVISTDKPDSPTGVIKILQKQCIIPKLLDFLSPEHDISIQSAAGDFIKALITISGNCNSEIASSIGPNELTRQLVSPEMIEKLIEIMLNGGHSLSNGVSIIIELIRKNNSDYDFVQLTYTSIETHPPNDRDPIYLGYLLKLFAASMSKFKNILTSIALPDLETAFGKTEPFGFERFKICELVAELLHCSNMTLLNDQKGETIVKERDSERGKILKDQEDDMNYTLKHEESREVQVPNDIEYDSHEEIELSTRLEDMKLDEHATDTNISNKDELKTMLDKPYDNNDDDILTSERPDDHLEDYQDASENEVISEVYSENIPDTEEVERDYRERPTPGDLLKISLQDTRIIESILNMFFKFKWNNFLHNVVFDIVQQIFSGPLKTGYNRFLISDLLREIKLTDLIIKGNEESEKFEKDNKIRLGYMGHLTLIAEEIVKFEAYIEEMRITFTNSYICDCLKNPNWKNYTDTVLADLRDKYNTILGDINDEENLEDEESNGYFSRDQDNSQENRDCDEDFEGSNPYVKSDDDVVGDELKDEDDAEFTESDGLRYYDYENEDGSKSRLLSNHHGNNDYVDDKAIIGRLDSVTDDLDKVNDDENNVFTAYMSQELRDNFKLGGTQNKSISENFIADDTLNEEDTKDSIDRKNLAHGFLMSNIPSRSSPSTPELANKNVFQHQFESESYEHKNSNPSLFNNIDDEDEDDYVDPNDDGQSYSKANAALYGNEKWQAFPGFALSRTVSHEEFYDEQFEGNSDSDAELESPEETPQSP